MRARRPRADRRPRRLSQFAGNQPTLNRLIAQIGRWGLADNLFAFFGPSGVGKTTLARILGRRHVCQGARPEDIEPCGVCETCQRNLEKVDSAASGTWAAYYEFKGAALTEEVGNKSKSQLNEPGALVIDEGQEVEKRLQQIIRTDIEELAAPLVLTTTDIFLIDDALRNRFANHIFELVPPTPDEVADVLDRIMKSLNMPPCPREMLIRVAVAHPCDMRKCTDAVYVAEAQAPGKVIAEDFLDKLFGPSRPRASEPTTGEGVAVARRQKI